MRTLHDACDHLGNHMRIRHAWRSGMLQGTIGSVLRGLDGSHMRLMFADGEPAARVLGESMTRRFWQTHEPAVPCSVHRAVAGRVSHPSQARTLSTVCRNQNKEASIKTLHSVNIGTSRDLFGSSLLSLNP